MTENESTVAWNRGASCPECDAPVYGRIAQCEHCGHWMDQGVDEDVER